MIATRRDLSRSFALSAVLIAASPVRADPPATGSAQWEKTRAYSQFFRSIRNCCSLADGRMDMPEIPVISKDDNGMDGDAIVYRVVMRREDYDGANFARLFPEGKNEVVALVPRRAVILGTEVEKSCGPIRAYNNAARLADPSVAPHTCNAPMDNVLWVSQYGGSVGQPQVLCYWPRPNGG